MARDEAYRLAEQKIEKARRTGSIILDLSAPQWRQPKSPQLTELPETLRSLSQLQSLNLAYNQLTVLPEWLSNLSHLQWLNLSYNQLRVLPEQPLNFSHLQSLDLSGNKLTMLPASFNSLSQLKSLNLSSTWLVSLPEWLGSLSQLESLNLSGIWLLALPEWLGNLTALKSLNLSGKKLTVLPDWLDRLTHLKSLDISGNQLVDLPEWIGDFVELQTLDLSNNKLSALPNVFEKMQDLVVLLLTDNKLTSLPHTISNLYRLKILSIAGNQFKLIPECVYKLRNLSFLGATNNIIEIIDEEVDRMENLEVFILGGNTIIENNDRIFDFISSAYSLKDYENLGNSINFIPTSLIKLKKLRKLTLDNNPLDPELAAAYKEGIDAVKSYLRAKAGAQVALDEAKLILVGEGEVGKSCLMDALEGVPWQTHESTHGIEIRPVIVKDVGSGKRITLNGWDFGGQRVYRPTHQLFFSAPAVYLVVWKPREGPQQGFVKDWIKLIKHREPDAKVLVVATHGGPRDRQPDIDRQELRDLFSGDTVIDFFHVDSKPDANGTRRGIAALNAAIGRVAVGLPEMGRTVPKRWEEARQALKTRDVAYLPLDDVLDLCREHGMDDTETNLFVTISHRLGHLIHYEHDPALRDLVVLKPDWLATAISFVLDDKQTRDNHGLVSFARLQQLWNDPTRAEEFRYPDDLHPIFLRLMERFDLSYRVAGLPTKDGSDEMSLVAQLVPDNRPVSIPAWASSATGGTMQQEQICRIVDTRNGQSATAEGLFYQLIVRLHKYSLGRVNYKESVHWQRGLVLDDDYNGRALLEHVGNDVRITVRAAYPERFLSVLTSEVKYLVDSFWNGLRCDVMVPCTTPCGRSAPGTGLYDVRMLIESKQRGRPEYPCAVCNTWQDIDTLLRNAPAAQPVAAASLGADYDEVKRALAIIYQTIQQNQSESRGRFDRLDASDQRILSQVDDAYTGLMQALTDEAKEGPRLFSLVPIERSKLGFFAYRPKKVHYPKSCIPSIGSPRSALSRDGLFGRFLHRHDRVLG